MNETQLPAVQTAEREVTYTPFGADEAIKLTTRIIRDFIAVPTKDGDLPDDRDAMRFLMLCRSQKLNPFAGDSFLIGWKDRSSNTVKWNLVTAHTAFCKRAETHPDFNGIKSGVIVKDATGKLVEREGDFTLDDDQLLGGWAIVEFKQRAVPMVKRVKLSTYSKPFGVWQTDPAGMICKVAEVHALRDAFPTLLGGLYLREEAEIIPVESSIKTPDFGRTPTRMLPTATAPTAPPTPPANVTGSALPPGVKPAKGKTASVPQQDNTTNKPARVAEFAPGGVQTAPTVGKAAPAPATPQPEQVNEQVQTPPDGGEQPQSAENAGQGQDPESLGESSGRPEMGAPETEFVPRSGESEQLTQVRMLMHRDKITEAQVAAVLRKIPGMMKPEQKLSDLSTTKLTNVAKSWNSQLPKYRENA